MQRTDGMQHNHHDTPAVNAQLLRDMMDCVDTTNFPMERKQSWMTLRSLVSGNDANMSNELNRGTSLETMLQLGGYNAAPPNAQSGGNVKTETPNYSKFNAKDSAAKLKRLLSSGSFSTMEKKASVSALLGLLETQQGGAAISRADANELLRNLGADYSEDELKQLSGQNLFRSFIHTPGQTMDRKKSFDVIQGILNSSSNTAIHKPMTSQDSFRFQNLANCLDTIETAVAKYEEDAGDEDEHVVAVDDNLDNLLDDNIAAQPPAQSNATAKPTGASLQQATSDNAAQFGRSSGLSAGGQPNLSAYGTAGRAPQQHPSNGQYGYLNSTQQHLDATGLASGLQQQQQHVRRDMGSYDQQQQAFQHHQQQTLHQQQANHLYGNPDLAYGRSSLPPPPPHVMAGAGNQYMYNYNNPHHQQQLQQLHHQQQQQQQHNHQLLQHQHNQQLPHQISQHPQPNYPSHGMYQTPSQMPSSSVPYGYGYAATQNSAASVPPAAPQAARSGDSYQQEPAAAGGADNTQYAKFCISPGCNNIARTKGMCKVHGGGRRCKVDGCMKSAQTGHLCIAHGGGKPCRMDGCPKTAQSRGLCKQHGGGVRCKFDGCTKSCQSGGYCRGHGGGKRCEFSQCKKWAQRNGFCAKHAQEMTT